MARTVPTFKPSAYHTQESQDIRAHYESDPELAEAMRAKSMGMQTGFLDRGVINLHLVLIPAFAVVPGIVFALGSEWRGTFGLGLAVFLEIALIYLGVAMLSEAKGYRRFKKFLKAAPSGMFQQTLNESESRTSEELHAWLLRTYGIRIRDGQAQRDIIARCLLVDLGPAKGQLLEVELEKPDGFQAQGYLQDLGNGEFSLLRTNMIGRKQDYFPQQRALSLR